MAKIKVLVRGPALTQSGYGEHTRALLRALREREDLFDIFLVTVRWGQTSWLWEDTEERAWIDFLLQKTIAHDQQQGQYDLSMQVTIPNEWERLAPKNIGVTAGIETSKVSPQWIEKAYLMDRIITISEHSKHVYEKTKYQAQHPHTGEVVDVGCNTPIDIVHYPVKEIKPADIDLDLEFDFNFLSVALWGPRKNMENLVKWWVEENKDREVGLILKTGISKASILDRRNLKNRMDALMSTLPEDRKCKVYLLHGYMSEPEMQAVYQHPKIKAYVTTTHGEGFGLPIFESAYNGLPVIAPAWSGHCDFLYAPVENKKGKKRLKALFSKVDFTLENVAPESVWEGVIQPDAMWCNPTEASFKRRVREIQDDYGRFKANAKILEKWLMEEFDFDIICDKWVDSILKVVSVPEQTDDDWLDDVADIIKKYE